MNETPESALEEIHRQMSFLAAAEYEHRSLPEFLECLEEGEDWVKKMRNFLRAD